MTTKSSLFLASIAFSLIGSSAPSFATSEGHATSLGTSRVRTSGGTNTVKLSVMNGSSIAAARQIVNSIYNKQVQYLHQNGNYYAKSTDLRTMLTAGFSIAHYLPAELSADATAISVRPWGADDQQVLSKRVTGAVARRLSLQAGALVGKANRLHAKGEITDASLTHAQFIGGLWDQTAKYFAESEKVLVKNRVTVELDK